MDVSRTNHISAILSNLFFRALLQYKVGLDEVLLFNCGGEICFFVTLFKKFPNAGSLISVDYILTSASCINEDL